MKPRNKITTAATVTTALAVSVAAMSMPSSSQSAAQAAQATSTAAVTFTLTPGPQTPPTGFRPVVRTGTILTGAGAVNFSCAGIAPPAGPVAVADDTCMPPTGDVSVQLGEVRLSPVTFDPVVDLHQVASAISSAPDDSARLAVELNHLISTVDPTVQMPSISIQFNPGPTFASCNRTASPVVDGQVDGSQPSAAPSSSTKHLLVATFGGHRFDLPAAGLNASGWGEQHVEADAGYLSPVVWDYARDAYVRHLLSAAPADLRPFLGSVRQTLDRVEGSVGVASKLAATTVMQGDIGKTVVGPGGSVTETAVDVQVFGDAGGPVRHLIIGQVSCPSLRA